MKKFLTLILIVAICFGAGLALSYFMAGEEGSRHLVDLVQSEFTLLPVVLGGGCYFIYLLNHLTDEKKAKLGLIDIRHHFLILIFQLHPCLEVLVNRFGFNEVFNQ